MSTKNDVSRITIEIPKSAHKKLKAQAALLGKSMREIILEALQANESCLYSNHEPNKETIRSIKNIESGKNLTKVKDLKALAKEFGL